MSEGHTDRLDAALGGRYTIERRLGEGGMATVYLAEDVKHKRKVALKILRPELAAVLGTDRFLAEIRTTAQLQHPHILPLHDSGEAEGYLYYVMPYVDGETLREKLDREKQLGVEESVRIATDVADALDYAHRHGVIHRDIKPANVLLHDGRPVVADFGIALAVSAAGGGRMTETGLSLGTPHYMSPEQASADRDLSARSDIYSLGCVLYEMLAGQPPHTGPSAQSILMHILTEDPKPLAKLRHTVPANVAAAVAKSIEKLPADRFGSAKELRAALEDEGFTYEARPRTSSPAAHPAAVAAAAPRAWLGDRRSVAAVVVGLGLTALAAVGWLRPGPPAEPGVPTRTEVSGLGRGAAGGWRLAISPDGRWLVAVDAGRGVGRALYIRSADDVQWRQLPNTEGASNPTFSPDGQSIAFESSGQISKVPITGGPALLIATPGTDPHWGLDGTIVYSAAGSLYRVGSAGGEPQLLLASDSIAVNRPHLLPTGRAVVFGTGGLVSSRVVLYEIETGEVRELVPAGSQPRYVPTGHLIYAHRDGALMGVPFDLERLETTGPQVTLLPSLGVRPVGTALFAVSETGTLIYEGGSLVRGDFSFVEVTRDGVETPLPVAGGNLRYPRYSPDGGRVGYNDDSGLRIYDVVTGASPQFGSGVRISPVWSSNGEYIYYAYALGGPPNGFRRRADGREEETRVWDRPNLGLILDVAPGDSLGVVIESTPERGLDLLVARTRGDEVQLDDFLTAQWNERNASISPDGRWIAYTSDESGEDHVYVHSFPTPTVRRRISAGTATDPAWSPDGRELYYRRGSGFYAVRVTTEPSFEVSSPELLFDEASYSANPSDGNIRNWDVHPDGSRFLMVKATATGGDGEASAFGPVYLVTNWFTELRERMEGS